jgi:hypothetical protein
MSGLAKVTSIDAIRAFSAAIQVFAEEAAAALDYLDLQVKRAQQWIGHDQKQYWTLEVKKGWDRVAQARAELERCLTFRKAGDHQPGCIDEKKALQRVQRRLRIAEEKVQAVRRWEHVIDRHVLDLTGSNAQMSDWIHAELPKALAALERMAGALESYVAVDVASEGSEKTSAARAAGSAEETGEDQEEDQDNAADSQSRKDEANETVGPDDSSSSSEAGSQGSPSGSG